MVVAFLGLGSNIEDRFENIQKGIRLIESSENITVIAKSNIYETEPIGVETELWFLNTVLKIETSLSSDKLLELSLSIEEELGRIRNSPMDKQNTLSRTLDIDILFFGNEIINSEKLQVPHPRLHLRGYTLIPLIELDPSLIHPIINQNVLTIYNTLLEPEEVHLYGTRRED